MRGRKPHSKLGCACRARGITLDALAQILGVSRATVSYYARRGPDLSMTALERIAGVLDCPIGELV